MSAAFAAFAIAIATMTAGLRLPTASAAGAGAEAAPEAKALLESVAKSYRETSSYADRGQFVAKLRTGADVKTLTSPISVAFRRPDRIEIVANEFRLVCDGKTLAMTQFPLKTYGAQPFAGPLTPQALEVACPQLAALAEGGADGRPLWILLRLLLDPDSSAALLKSARSLTLEADRDQRRSLVYEHEFGVRIRLLINPKTLRVERAEVLTKTDKPTSNASSTIQSLAWEAGEFLNAPSDEAFAIKPPKDFAVIAPLEKAFADEPKAEDPQAGRKNKLIGQQAPEFTIDVLEADGKVRKVSKADLAGKVVLIDFWATWCGPCLRELPEIQKIVEYYHELKKDVVVIALSQDDDPNDLPGVSKLVEKTLTDQNLALRKDRTGLVALDPSHRVGEAFGVRALPTVVILEPSGIVKSVHIGFNPQIRETLGQEIDSLLANPQTSKPK